MLKYFAALLLLISSAVFVSLFFVKCQQTSALEDGRLILEAKKILKQAKDRIESGENIDPSDLKSQYSDNDYSLLLVPRNGNKICIGVSIKYDINTWCELKDKNGEISFSCRSIPSNVYETYKSQPTPKQPQNRSVQKSSTSDPAGEPLSENESQN